MNSVMRRAAITCALVLSVSVAPAWADPPATSSGGIVKAAGASSDHSLGSDVRASARRRTAEEAVRRLRQLDQDGTLVAQLKRMRYEVRKRDARGTESPEWQVTNPVQQFSAVWRPSGIEVHPAVEPAAWRIAMRLDAWGYGNRLESSRDAEIAVSGNRLEYRHRNELGTALTEWYVHTSRGIEQGFTLPRRPAGAEDAGPLKLVIAMNGTLQPRLAGDRQAIEFSRSNGTVPLRYSELRSWDAKGRLLPSSLHIAAGRVSILVDDAKAVYPVTVDPLLHTETKATASDAAAGTCSESRSRSVKMPARWWWGRTKKILPVPPV